MPPSDQLRTLKELARAVHEEGKTLRLWASPEKEADMGVFATRRRELPEYGPVETITSIC